MSLNKKITSKLRVRHHIWYIMTLVIVIIWLKLALFLVPKIDVKLARVFITGFVLCGLLSFLISYTRNEIKKGTFTLVLLRNEGFAIIKPFSYRMIKWEDVIEVLYNNNFDHNCIYIEIKYCFDKNRLTGIINIHYTEAINKFINNFCKGKILNPPNEPIKGNQELTDLLSR